ncbi:MAG: nickel pincer cofactor biosynthesis protein LarC [Nitrospina sp.]|nr:nickel pincer cofactor biosynthesis protein LarC [Nitrospina sp.]MBT4046911.1 nickel pincer cofactor biosynthesis protein LarC [Nitrospina sp.]MBT4557367.1 nickel pincer cofactor biosynthesis protein LarC [Nitrospina sp.]MBT5350008.1 nickel pincer cofactor biosynthesis protein LarC [Nitrospina sp.]MBT5652598.1 nickel pincer cofactor biosynthesis protein LarC [Nitrospina sp.]
MRAAYFDCYSGISGDMILGALFDLGVDPGKIRKALNTINLKGYKLKTKQVKRGLISGTKAEVRIDKSPPAKPTARKYSDIKKLLTDSDLSSVVKKNSQEIFKRIARVEAAIHKTTLDKIHFHEVGAVDSIVDIVGGVVAIESLKIDKIFASPLNVGEGFVQCAHGCLPVPAPATLKLLKGVPIFSSGIEKELTTPTGAAMIGFYADKFGSLPGMRIVDDGYGAGDHIIPEMPNMLRVVLGDIYDEPDEELVVIETNIDDMNPEFYESVMDSLFKAGALDVYFTPIIMKKSRPANKVSVLSSEKDREILSEILLRDTSSFGVRFYRVGRMVLEREIKSVKTSWGLVKVKIGKFEGEVVQISPEYEDCKIISLKKKVSIKMIHDEARLQAIKI